MLANKEVSESEYKQFYKNYCDAFTSPVNKKERLAKCYDILEKEMTLLGATAIEDCLQDDLSKNQIKIE
jgi:magnesium-transporting ATPase (P-type)